MVRGKTLLLAYVFCSIKNIFRSSHKSIGVKTKQVIPLQLFSKEHRYKPFLKLFCFCYYNEACLQVWCKTRLRWWDILLGQIKQFRTFFNLSYNSTYMFKLTTWYTKSRGHRTRNTSSNYSKFTKLLYR